MYVSYPRFFEGEREEDRLKWYASTTAKDIVMTAEVSLLVCKHSSTGVHDTLIILCRVDIPPLAKQFLYKSTKCCVQL